MLIVGEIDFNSEKKSIKMKKIEINVREKFLKNWIKKRRKCEKIFKFSRNMRMSCEIFSLNVGEMYIEKKKQ